MRNTAALETRSVVASFSGWFKSPARDASDAGRRARPSAMASSLAPERVRYVRVAVVGDTGCGKSTLVRHLAGDPRDELVERTTGVNARVRLVDVPDPRTGAPRPHFVELWDVGCRDEHKIERRVFYADLDGVLLVHDLSLRRSARRLRKWAREIAASATFASPTPDHCDWSVGVDAVRGTPDAPHVLRGFGGLPVPALVVANKADLDRGAGAPGDGGAQRRAFDPGEAIVEAARAVWIRIATAFGSHPRGAEVSATPKIKPAAGSFPPPWAPTPKAGVTNSSTTTTAAAREAGRRTANRPCRRAVVCDASRRTGAWTSRRWMIFSASSSRGDTSVRTAPRGARAERVGGGGDHDRGGAGFAFARGGPFGFAGGASGGAMLRGSTGTWMGGDRLDAGYSDSLT